MPLLTYPRRPESRPLLRVELLEDRAVPATLLVDDDKAQYPTAKYTSIQAAVDAARTGDTILVARGTYTEQVTFAADKDRITLRAQSAAAVIQAPSALTGDVAAIVTIDGADGVTVRGFTIKGPANPNGSLDYGVAVDGGSATIRDNFITDIRNDPLDGTQTGVGVVVLGDQSKASAVIRDNTITDYQKGGVVIFGADASATVSNNTILGDGATDVIAQNGIQVSEGASAVITGNDVRGNLYTGDDDVDAAGILADTAGRVLVYGNRVRGNGIGVLAVATDGFIVSDNRVSGNALYGISVGGATGGVIQGNRVEGNGDTGIVVADSSAVLIAGNRVRGNGVYGLSLLDGAANNLIVGNTLRGNGDLDLFDDTTGRGTAGTANYYFRNSIGSASPDDLLGRGSGGGRGDDCDNGDDD